MNVLAGIAVAVGLVVLLVSALMVVVVGLLSRSPFEPFPRLADPDDGEPQHDGPGALSERR